MKTNNGLSSAGVAKLGHVSSVVALAWVLCWITPAVTAQEGPLAKLARREPPPMPARSTASDFGEGDLGSAEERLPLLGSPGAVETAGEIDTENDSDGTWWKGWKPSLPKLTPPKITPPKITMPDMEMPRPMEWAKKVNQGTRQMVGKTKDVLTAPFQAWSNPPPPTNSRPAKSREPQDKPGFWSRMFSAEEEEPEPPRTVADFLRQPRVSNQD